MKMLKLRWFLLFPMIAVGPWALGGQVKSSIEIKDKKSIGEISIGETRENLEKRGAKFGTSGWDKNLGTFGPLNFEISEDQKVRTITIDDLRTITAKIIYKGKGVPPTATWDELKKIFAPCEPGNRFGGVFIQCPRSGLVLGYSPGHSRVFISMESESNPK